MPNDYDKIMRENMGRIFLPLVERHCNFEITELLDMPSSLVKTHHREPDFLKMLKTAKGEQVILHIEYQSNNDADMVYRMQSYHAILMEKYRLPIKQMVFYLGSRPLRMRTKLYAYEIMTGFEVIDFSQMDVNEFLQSENLELMMMAILANFGERDPKGVIQEIIDNVLKSDRNEEEKGRIIQQLTVIGKIRKLGREIKNVLDNMPLTIDISDTWFFQKGEEKGEKRGLAKGEKLGIAKGEKLGLAKGEKLGIAKSKVNFATNMLKAGELSLENIAEYSGLTLAEVIAIRDKMEP